MSSSAPARTLRIRVKLHAKVGVLSEQPDGVWLAQLKSPPVDGKANEELIGLVARHFGCAKSAVAIKSGHASRMKLVTLA